MVRPLCLIVLALAAVLSQAQTKPSFEVATVKPNASGENRIAIMGQPGGRFVATNIPLTMLMGSAYRVRDFQIMGGPNWIRMDRWNSGAPLQPFNS